MATWAPVTDAAKTAFLTAEVFRLWGLPPGRASPCPLPQSMSAADLATVAHQPYLVAPKHDGVRHLLLLTQYPRDVNVAVLVTRGWQFFPITVCAKGPVFKRGSLFDGELTREPLRYADCSAQWRLMYWVFDAVAVAGECLVPRDYRHRLGVLQGLFFDAPGVDEEALRNPAAWHNVTAPTIVRQSGKLVPVGNAHYLGFRAKQWRPTQQVLQALADMDACAADGLVFMPVLDGVCVTRKHARMFKWKTRHTVDLLAVKDGAGRVTLQYHAAAGATDEPVAGRYRLVHVGDTLHIPAAVPAVCEFLIVAVADGTVSVSFVCARPDKENANCAAVVAATIDNHVHPVTRDDLARCFAVGCAAGK